MVRLLFSRHIARAQSFQEDRHFNSQVSVVLKTLVSLMGRLDPCIARIAADRRTHTHTETVAGHARRGLRVKPARPHLHLKRPWPNRNAAWFGLSNPSPGACVLCVTSHSIPGLTKHHKSARNWGWKLTKAAFLQKWMFYASGRENNILPHERFWARCVYYA